MAFPNATCYLGTLQGLYQVDLPDVVTPLTTERESVTALAATPGGGLAAGCASGKLYRLRRDLGRWEQIGALPGAAIHSLFVFPGAKTRLLASTRDGQVFESLGDRGLESVELPRNGSARPELPTALCKVPRRPNALLAVRSGHSLLEWIDGGPFRTLDRPLPEPIWQLAVHPRDPELWWAAGDASLWRSTDAGHTWRALSGVIAGPPRGLLFESRPPHRLFVLSRPAEVPDGPTAPSPLAWVGPDGEEVRAWPSEAADRVRDPSGEITSFSLYDAPGSLRLLYGTDRGELIAFCPQRAESERILTDLPPIHAVLATSGHPLDPSSSGIYVLP